MEKNESSLIIYDEQLIIINGIKFTHREIDVMALIFHMRGSSKIASLLSISSRTVETHTANIMRKMDTNSREGIIDFIEKKGHSTRIKRHHQALILQVNFQKKLQDICALIKNKRIGCSVILNSSQKKEDLFVAVLKKYLIQCGLNISLITTDAEIYQPTSIPDKLHFSQQHFLCLINPEFVEQLEIDKKNDSNLFSRLIPKSFQDINSHTFIVHNSSSENFSEHVHKENYIFFKETEEYYFLFFTLLKRILQPHINLDEIITTFKNSYEQLIDTSIKSNIRDDITPRKWIHMANFSQGWGVKVAFASAILGAVYLGYRMPFFDRPTPTSKDSKHLRAIRSDLAVPAGNTFLNRPNIITKINESLKGNDGIQAVALVGIGGAGKTTIARKYALQQNFSVVWEINAATRETLKDSFERLAYALCQTEEENRILLGLQNIKNNVEREERILLFVKGKLKHYSNWFLIYDNVERFTNIQKYFPCDATVWGNGKIIITTTNSNTKNNNLINNFIHVGELSAQEKLSLFIKIMGIKNSQESIDTQEKEASLFLSDIPPFPLDVSIAAYYLKSTHTSYQKYLERLEGKSKDFETIQADVVKEASGYTKTRYNIVILSLIDLINTNKDFVDLMLLISFLDIQNIPRSLLSNYKEDTVIDNFIYNLKKYSLITSESSENSISTFSLHRSTQEIILAYLTKTLSLSSNSPQISSIATTLENYVGEAIDNEDFSRMKLLVTHCEAFLSHDDLLSDSIKSSLGGALGCIYYYLRHNSKAKQLLEESLVSLKSCYGEHHEKIARVLVYLGNFYRAHGDYEKAKSLLEQSLIIYKRNPNFVRNAKALGYLGAVYRDSGEYKKSKVLFEQSLEIYEKYSHNHIAHGWILAHLANVYIILGDYTKAKNLLEKSLIIYKKQSEDYVGVAWVLNYLGNLQKIMGNYEEAQKLINQCLYITRKYFSNDHIFVASGQFSLAGTYIEMGNYQSAKNLLNEALVVYERNFGQNHIETARVLRVLGEAYCLEGDMETAEDLFNKSLLIFQQKHYPESYKSLECLADLYLKRAKQATGEGDTKQAQNFNHQSIVYLIQALEILRDCFGKDSPHIINIEEKLVVAKKVQAGNHEKKIY